jgi:hypothetical protein
LVIRYRNWCYRLYNDFAILYFLVINLS